MEKQLIKVDWFNRLLFKRSRKIVFDQKNSISCEQNTKFHHFTLLEIIIMHITFFRSQGKLAISLMARQIDFLLLSNDNVQASSLKKRKKKNYFYRF